jgi:hypothetical protein
MFVREMGNMRDLIELATAAWFGAVEYTGLQERSEGNRYWVFAAQVEVRLYFTYII